MSENISFGGVKNMSYFSKRALDADCKPVRERWMNIEVTGKDLHRLRRALKRGDISKNRFQNPFRDNYININTYSTIRDESIAINNEMLIPSKETMPLFTEIARLTRKIRDRAYKNFYVDKEYLESYDFTHCLKLGDKMDYQESLMVHDAYKVKSGASYINKVVQRIMEKYFAN